MSTQRPVHGTLVTLGGGGFSMPEVHGRDFSPIDDLLLSMSGVVRPKVCFLGTASGDADGYHDKFLAAFADRAECRVLSLFNKAPADHALPIADKRRLLEQDIVYVGGGSTANLLAVWRLHGLPELLRQAAAGGTILAGISAGANCWYEASSTDSFGPNAPLPDGLGFLPGSFCPHYLGEETRRETYLRFVAEGSLPGGYAADDGVALVWRDGALVEAISERADPVAVRVDRDGARGAADRLSARLDEQPRPPAQPRSTDVRRRERHQTGVPARRRPRRHTGRLPSGGNAAGAPVWWRVAGGERWIWAQ